MPTVLYLHGFLSSPQSHKAQVTQQWLNTHRPNIDFICPLLSSHPETCHSEVLDVVSRQNASQLFVIGSSLGGFWANILIESKFAQRAVLINPAVKPGQLFQQLVGQRLKHYHMDTEIELKQSDIDYLNHCEGRSPSQPNKYWVMLQTGDETLDYRLAQQKYQHCKLLLEPGGNHSFLGYDHWLPQIINFLDTNL